MRRRRSSTWARARSPFPGLLAGLAEAHRRFGRIDWPDLVEPAIELARAGVDVGEQQAFLHSILESMLLRDEGGRRLYGDPNRVETSDLVPTLELVRDAKADAARELIPELADDIDAYAVAERAPRHVDFAGRQVLTAAAPSRGGAVIAEALRPVWTLRATRSRRSRPPSARATQALFRARRT